MELDIIIVVGIVAITLVGVFLITWFFFIGLPFAVGSICCSLFLHCSSGIWDVAQEIWDEFGSWVHVRRPFEMCNASVQMSTMDLPLEPIQYLPEWTCIGV